MDHKLRAMRKFVGEVLGQLSKRFDSMYAPRRSSVDCARETVAGAVASDAPFDPRLTIADGTSGLQTAVPLNRGTEPGR
jgi:hypothetical protein